MLQTLSVVLYLTFAKTSDFNLKHLEIQVAYLRQLVKIPVL